MTTSTALYASENRRENLWGLSLPPAEDGNERLELLLATGV